MFNLKDIHDWIINSLIVEYSEERISISLTNPDQLKFMLIINNFSELACSNLMPWGKSDSILKSEIFEQEGLKKLHMEMQSGDLIIIAFAGALVFQEKMPEDLKPK